MALSALLSPLQERFVRWITRHERTASQAIRLHRRRIYILPTRHGLYYGLLVFVMLLGSINYSNSMAFILTFLLASLGANAMWQTHRNLLGLNIRFNGVAPVFAGQEAVFHYQIENPTRRVRYALALQWQEGPLSVFDVPAEDNETAVLRVPATRRGRLEPGRFRILSRYPLGLFQAWSWLSYDSACLVYPRPITTDRPLPRAAGSKPGEGQAGQGSEDFSGLRDYAEGDPLRHVAWKAAARSDDLLTKQFHGAGREEVWLDWGVLHGIEPELRLSILCRWVLDAEAEGLRYGLRLPGIEYVPDHGEVHRDHCLRALALHDLPRGNAA
ncbi:MAG: DUF58 domain-containing protein [Gammaproteobacteria bacterium]|jgi:uncharacterized protein (DUF58 family)